VYKFPAIPEPTTDVRSLQASVASLKEAVELLTGQRGAQARPVSWGDLVRLGIVTEQDIPR